MTSTDITLGAFDGPVFARRVGNDTHLLLGGLRRYYCETERASTEVVVRGPLALSDICPGCAAGYLYSLSLRLRRSWEEQRRG